MVLLSAIALTLASTPRALTGNVVYRQRIAIPYASVVTVTLENRVTKEVVAESRYKTGGAQSPLPFSLTIMPGAVGKGKDYTLRATIEAEGRTWFAGTSKTTVISNGRYKADILVTSAAPADKRSVDKKMEMPLQGTKWTLIEIDGHPPIEGLRGFPNFVLDAEKGQMHGNFGVNSFGGTFTIHDKILTIMPGMSTRMAGKPEVMRQERDFNRILSETTGWTIEKDILTLKTGEDVLAKFRGEVAP